MATPGRASRRQTVSNDALVELPPPSLLPKRPARRKTVVENSTDDVLTPEEEYLLKVLRRCSSNTNASAVTASLATSNNQTLKPPIASRSPSPPVLKSSSPPSKGRPVAGGSCVDSKPGTASSTVPKADEQPAPAPTDAVSRAKMILEKKRKAASAVGFGLSRLGSATSSGAAGGLKKAKITKVSGTPASNPRLDPVKYPASGLLLSDDFQSFVEISKNVFEPGESLVRALKNFGIADSNSNADGLVQKQLYETLVMRVTVPSESQGWAINICPKVHNEFKDVLFHFNPRRRYVAMNNRENDNWGQQEKHMLTARWPEVFNVSINVAVQIDSTGFHVAVDGKYCATFAHRTNLPTSGEQLTLQVMNRDDYGANLMLVVHEIWWGHKDTMPGLVGRDKEPSRRTADTRRGGSSNEASTDLHVAGLPPMPTPEVQESIRKRLVDMFEPYGATQVRVLQRDPKNYGFIKFREANQASKALEELDGAEVHGKPMRLSKAGGR